MENTKVHQSLIFKKSYANKGRVYYTLLISRGSVLVNFSPRLLTERVTMLLFFIPIAAATPLPRSNIVQFLKGQRC